MPRKVSARARPFGDRAHYVADRAPVEAPARQRVEREIPDPLAHALALLDGVARRLPDAVFGMHGVRGHDGLRLVLAAVYRV